MPTPTTNLGLTQILGADAATEYRLAINANATTIDPYSLLTSVVTNTTSASVLRGQSVIASPSTTQTLPATTANAMVAVTASSTVTGATPVTVSGSSIYGVGLSAVSSFTLGTSGACVVLQSDGTNWFVVGGRQDTLAVSRGATNIATSQSASSTTYTTLATPDQVTGIVLPTNGRLQIGVQAMWSETNAGAARAAIFIGSNQLQVQIGNPTFGPGIQEASLNGGANFLAPLYTQPGKGLASVAPTQAFAGDVTTGQTIGLSGGGGAVDVFAAAGTYTVSLQFKSTAGSVTVQNRKLWVQAIPFS